MNEINYQKKYLKKARLFAGLLQLVPFIRAVILTGSLARGKAGKSSDIDFLIVAKAGRIFSVRFFSVLLVLFLGQKRPKDEEASHAGKFCLNHFLTESYLKIPNGRGSKIDQYCSGNFIYSSLLWEEGNIASKFTAENGWIFKDMKMKTIDSIEPFILFKIYRTFIEYVLRGKTGDKIEIFLRNIQIRSIESDQRTKKYPQLIAYNENELRFHPPKVY